MPVFIRCRLDSALKLAQRRKKSLPTTANLLWMISRILASSYSHAVSYWSYPSSRTSADEAMVSAELFAQRLPMLSDRITVPPGNRLGAPRGGYRLRGVRLQSPRKRRSTAHPRLGLEARRRFPLSARTSPPSPGPSRPLTLVEPVVAVVATEPWHRLASLVHERGKFPSPPTKNQRLGGTHRRVRPVLDAGGHSERLLCRWLSLPTSRLAIALAATWRPMCFGTCQKWTCCVQSGVPQI